MVAFRSGQLLPLAVAGVVAAGMITSAAIWSRSHTPAAPPTAPSTARVERGTVSLGLLTDGTLSAAKTANLGFPVGGRLEALYVKVGDPVTRGQVLASEDQFSAQQALNQAQTQLGLGQIGLQQVLGDVRIAQSRTIERRDRAVADSHDRQADLTRRGDEIAIRQAADNLHTAEQQCLTSAATTSLSTTTTPVTPCSENSTVIADRDALQNAELGKQKDDAASETTHRSDRVTLAFDQAAVQVGVKNRPAAIANARAAVKNQEAALAAAQRTLDFTTLRAPTDGVVTAITGQPGDFVNGGGPAAPLAPGGHTQLPGVGRDPNEPGGAFMVLQPAHSFEMTVPVKQADVVNLKPNQRVNTHPDAIPDLHLTGSVTSVAPSAVNTSSGPSYYVSVLLNATDPRLRDGMTTKVAITTSTLDNVLVVPDSAVIRQNNQTFVDVLGPDGKPTRVAVQVGPNGFDNTQILSGLTEGQQVVLQK